MPKDKTLVTDTTENAPVENAAAIETPAAEEVTPPTKRKRGRPSNAERAAESAASVGASPVNDGSARPSKRAKKGAPSFDKEARLQLANQVKGLHALAAMGTGIPEFNLADGEAVMLADAMATVAEQYGLSLSGKTGALIQLAAACALVYAPRLAAVNARVKAARAKPVEGPAVTVTHSETFTDGAATSAH